MKKTLFLLTAILIFACSSDDSNNDNSNNPNSEIRISKLGLHSIQSCSSQAEIMSDSIKMNYNGQGFSSMLRQYRQYCYENDWNFADYDGWVDENVEIFDDNLILDYQYLADNPEDNFGGALQISLNNDGNISYIPHESQEDGYLSWSFEYNNGYVSQVVINEIDDYSSTGFIESTYTYNWLNGNLQEVNVSYNNSTSIVSYQYTDLINNARLFSGWSALSDLAVPFNPLFSNFCGRTTEKLPSVITYYNQANTDDFNSTRIYEFDYIFDNDGYVKFIVISLDYTNNFGESGDAQWTLEIEYTN
ncbi:MAG: hypothetical protein ACON5K_02420 [Bacteroidia bacterium]